MRDRFRGKLKIHFKMFEEQIMELAEENAQNRLLSGIKEGSVKFDTMSPEKKKKRNYLQSLKSKYEN